MDSDIKPGDKVRRVRGDTTVGTVRSTYVKRTMRDKEWGYRPCAPYLMARVHWPSTSWLIARDGTTSKVRASSLVKVDA